MSLRVFLLLFAALGTPALSGCDRLGAPESLFDEYLERAARVLDVPASVTPIPTAPQLPRRRERVRELPALDVGMLDFLSLYGCELQHVVGERNSIMGRVMHPSARLDYELRFIRAAEECVDEIGSERLAGRIREVIEIKRAALPDVIWNAVWGSEEVEYLLTRSRGPLAIGHNRDLASSMAADLRALEALVAAVRDGRYDVEVRALDSMYQRWQSRPLAGQAVRGALIAAIRLDDVSELIEARLGERPMCARPDLRPRAAENMRGMFMSVFVGHVQPYLADLQRVRRELIEPLAGLATLGDPGRSPLVAAYANDVLGDEADHALWRRFDLAVRRHVVAWQALLEQCGMRPALGQQ